MGLEIAEIEYILWVAKFPKFEICNAVLGDLRLRRSGGELLNCSVAKTPFASLSGGKDEDLHSGNTGCP